MARTEKQSDAMQMMRSIRDRISEEIKGMTFELPSRTFNHAI